MRTKAEAGRETLIRQIRAEAIASHHAGQDCNFIVGCELLAIRKGEAQGKPLEFCEYPYCANQCAQWISYQMQENAIEVSL